MWWKKNTFVNIQPNKTKRRENELKSCKWSRQFWMAQSILYVQWKRSTILIIHPARSHKSWSREMFITGTFKFHEADILLSWWVSVVDDWDGRETLLGGFESSRGVVLRALPKAGLLGSVGPFGKGDRGLLKLSFQEIGNCAGVGEGEGRVRRTRTRTRIRSPSMRPTSSGELRGEIRVNPPSLNSHSWTCSVGQAIQSATFPKSTWSPFTLLTSTTTVFGLGISAGSSTCTETVVATEMRESC